MKNLIYGFFMAWGMFLAIPCPFPRWREEARVQMSACLTLIGGMLGGLWALLAWGLGRLSCPPAVTALLLAAFPWLCSGFIHLDGFMDVCDAVLSRRDLEQRQRILKDSHCGAFAVICVCLLVLSQWCLFFSAQKPVLLPLAMLPVVTRACAGFAVLSLRPMRTSQYASTGGKTAGARCFLCVLLAVGLLLPLLFCGWRGVAGLAACGVYWLAAAYGYRRLDGMSGDISGFALCLGELAGAAVLCLWR